MSIKHVSSRTDPPVGFSFSLSGGANGMLSDMANYVSLNDWWRRRFFEVSGA